MQHSVLIPFGLLLDGWFEQVRSEEALAELEVFVVWGACSFRSLTRHVVSAEPRY